MTGYLYRLEDMTVIEEVTGDHDQIVDYSEQFDCDTVGLTFSPAFGFNGGLVNNTRPVVWLK